MADKSVLADAIIEYLFKDYSGTEASRLLLIVEDYSGKAKVTDAAYLGGWSKRCARDAVLRILESEGS